MKSAIKMAWDMEGRTFKHASTSTGQAETKIRSCRGRDYPCGQSPHRSGRAELPHPALTLGHNAMAYERLRMTTPLTPIPHSCLTYPLKRAGHAWPALSPGHVTLKQIPLGQPPSVHRLPGLRLGLVRRPCRYYGAVRLPMPVHHRGASLDFPMRSVLWFSHTQARDRISQSRSRCLRTSAGSQTARSSKASRPTDASSFAFHLFRRRRHPTVATASTVGFQVAAQWLA